MTTTPARDADRRQRWENAMAGPIANPRLIRSAATEGMHMADLEAAEVRAAAFDEMAKKQASRAEADAIRRRHSIATARRLVAAELREEAAAARTDNTTGA